MYRLFIHDDAKDDLEQLWAKDQKVAARVTVLLEEIEGDQQLLERLTDHGFGSHHAADVSISKWLAYWNKGKDLWRLKLWDLEDQGLRYRIIYAFVPGKRHYHVLAVAHRSFDYDVQHEITRRILRAYEDL